MQDLSQTNKSKLVLWKELSEKVKSNSQSVSEFYDEIRKEANNIGNIISEEELKMIFIYGLPVRLRRQVAGHETATLKEALVKAKFYEALDEVNETKDECFSNTIIGGKGSEICHQLAKLREDVKSVRNISSENERQGSKEQNCKTGVQGHEKNKLVMSSNTLKNEQYQIVARDNPVNFDKDMLIKTS